MKTKFAWGGINCVLPVAAVAAGALLLGGCQKNDGSSGGGSGSAPRATATSVQKNSFQAVTSQLDAGGNLYGYLSTEQWLDGLSGKVSGLRDLFKDIGGMSQSDRADMNKVFNVVTSLIKHCGIEDISGVGMSSIMKEKDVYRSKFVLHHYAGKGTGFLWTMFGDKAHAMKGMELLPATTAVASFSDFDLGMLWSVIQKEVDNAGVPDLSKALQEAPKEFEKATGLKLADVLGSLGNEYGLVITLDDTKKFTVPMGGQESLDLPEPGIMLAIKVKSDLIFDRIDAAIKENLGDNPSLIKTDKDGLKMRTMPVPVPVSINLRPSIARSGDYLFIASSDALILEALDVKAGKKPGLKDTEEFKRMSHDMPDQGNQFSFLSEKLGKVIADVQMQAMKNNARGNPGMVSFFQQIISFGGTTTAFSVSANGPEGWVTTGNGNRNPANIVLLPLVAVPAIAAGVAVPFFTRQAVMTRQSASPMPPPR